MKVEREKITPIQAKEILASKNNINRNLSANNVQFLAKQIEVGNWVENGQPIIFDSKGRLLNGQHRLAACLQANKPLWFLVVRGVSLKAIDTMDSGKSRTASDVFDMHNVKNARKIAAISNLLLQWEKQVLHFQHFPLRRQSNADVYARYMEDDENIQTCMRVAQNNIKWANVISVGAAEYVMFWNGYEEKFEQFLFKCSEGGDYTGSPSHSLPVYIASQRAKKLNRIPNEDFWLLLYSFDLWLNKQTHKGAFDTLKIMQNHTHYYDIFKYKR